MSSAGVCKQVFMVGVALTALTLLVPFTVWGQTTNPPFENGDAGSFAFILFQAIPDETAENCLAAFAYDHKKSDSSTDPRDFGGVLFDTLFEYSRNVDHRAIWARMTGGYGRINLVLPYDCERSQDTAKAIARFANRRQSEFVVLTVPPDSDALAAVEGKPLWQELDFEKAEWELRKSAIASPCSPHGWRVFADWYRDADSRASAYYGEESPYQTNARYMDIWADYLEGRDLQEAITERFSSSELRQFSDAIIQVQIQNQDCQPAE